MIFQQQRFTQIILLISLTLSLPSKAHNGKLLTGTKVKDIDFSTVNATQTGTCKAVSAFFNEGPKNCDKNSRYNKGIIESICAIKPGGGYDASLSAIPTSIHTLKIGQHYMFDASFRESSNASTTSYCGGASFTAFMMMLENLGDENPLNDISIDQAKNFDLFNYIKQSNGNYRYGNVSQVSYLTSKSPIRTSNFEKRDFIGLFGSFNNDYGGVVDANKAYNFGEHITKKDEACPGDLLKFDRKDGHGHSVVYLGQIGKKFCYWSSNGNGVPEEHEGFSIRCESSSAVNAWNFVRVTDKVQNLSRIKPYTGEKADWTTLGSGLMSEKEAAKYRAERRENDVEAELRLGIGVSRTIQKPDHEVEKGIRSRR